KPVEVVSDQPGAQTRRVEAQRRINVIEPAKQRAGRIDRPMRRAEALHAPTLLVDQHGRIRLAYARPQLLDERSDLPRAFDIPLEQNETPGPLRRDKGAFGLAELGSGNAGDERLGHDRRISPLPIRGSRKRQLIPLDEALPAGTLEVAAELHGLLRGAERTDHRPVIDPLAAEIGALD